MGGDQDVEVEVVPSLDVPSPRDEDGEYQAVAGLAAGIALLALGISTLTVLYLVHQAKNEGAAEVNG